MARPVWETSNAKRCRAGSYSMARNLCLSWTPSGQLLSINFGANHSLRFFKVTQRASAREFYRSVVRAHEFMIYLTELSNLCNNVPTSSMCSIRHTESSTELLAISLMATSACPRAI
ncbi:hypothetical protein BIW11_09577 [Tropilaelaps mercedesae]|uniref:Uncharacterized protein n=1 Tax=Tropilaelaps mercedesae TaxID=418985 RepID=A0A1V9XJS8_9ACAR|nr:hypothetical protein BIW11_09577 [Tropilaelaps mercedesae]